MSIDDMIAVLQAAKAGKQIQIKYHGCRDWIDCPVHPFWNFDDTYEIRVKPEPREFWLCYFGKEANIFAYDNESDARKHNMCKHIKVREVIEP